MLPMMQILKNMWMDRLRVGLTILAVAWGTFTISSMLAVGEGLRLTFGKAVQDMGEGALVVTGKQTTKSHHGQSNGIKIMLTQHDLDQLKMMLAGRAKVTGTIASDMMIYHGNKISRGFPITAVQPDYATAHAVQVLPGGRFINAADDQARRQVIVLGERTFNKLFKPNEQAIGTNVYLQGRPFLVVGVQRKSVQLIMTGQYPDEFTNWVPYSTYQALTNNYNYSNFLVSPANLAQVPQIQMEIRHFIADQRAVDRDDLGILEFINVQEEKQKIIWFFNGIEMILGIIGGLTLMVAGVGIANVMYISVRKATREIGIRMALGATTWDILSYYICEALLTTAVGGTVGLLLTTAMIFVIDQVPLNSEIFDSFGSPRPVFSLRLVLIVMMTLGAVGLLAGSLPARRAASINPAEALHDE